MLMRFISHPILCLQWAEYDESSSEEDGEAEPEPEKALVPEAPSPHTLRRKISFGDDEMKLISPRKRDHVVKEKLYWSKMDLQRMKIERDEEKFQSLVNSTGGALGFSENAFGGGSAGDD